MFMDSQPYVCPGAVEWAWYCVNVSMLMLIYHLWLLTNYTIVIRKESTNNIVILSKSGHEFTEPPLLYPVTRFCSL